MKTMQDFKNEHLVKVNSKLRGLLKGKLSK